MEPSTKTPPTEGRGSGGPPSPRWADQSFFHGVPTGLYRTAPTGEILDVNPALVAMLGYASAEELCAEDVQHTFVNLDDRLRYQEILERDGIVHHFEMQLRRKDGTTIWVEDSGHIVRKRDGTILFYEGSMQDVTERKRAEAALRESEERFRFILEHSGDAFYRLRFDTNFYDYMSPSIESLTGYTVAEIQELGWFTIVEQRITQTGTSITDEVISELRRPDRAGTYRADYLICMKDGTRRWLADHSEPWYDDAGNLIGSVGILSDITERKRLEEQVRGAQRMEALGKLAGGIAHDFNNLLTVINGYAELIQAQSGRGFLQEAAAQILAAGSSAAALTSQLLAFTRQQLVTPERIDLNQLLRRLSPTISQTMSDDISFTTVLAPDAGAILANPQQIEQIVLNLVTNAREAMPGGGKLTLQVANVELDESYTRLHPDAKPGSHVMLACGDTGRGMDASVRSRVFEPFFTTKDVREVGKGAGLGLAAVYGIVKQYGGSIEVYSEVGLGTTFKLYFPRIARLVSEAEQQAGQRSLPRGSETVLVVEDDQQLRLLARVLLQARGYQVLEAEGGEQALRLIETYPGPVQLLLTDVVMPGLNGPQVAERISAIRPSLKVMYMSGFTDDMVIRHGTIKPDVHFLQKPFTPATLAHKVREVLDGQERSA
jgi:PAS domain S-box-containing protein